MVVKARLLPPEGQGSLNRSSVGLATGSLLFAFCSLILIPLVLKLLLLCARIQIYLSREYDRRKVLLSHMCAEITRERYEDHDELCEFCEDNEEMDEDEDLVHAVVFWLDVVFGLLPSSCEFSGFLTSRTILLSQG